MRKCLGVLKLCAVAMLIAGPRIVAAEDGRLTFRVKVSALGLQVTNALATGKAPTDFVELSLPGRLYVPPKPVGAVAKAGVDRSTPEQAAGSDFSANQAGDPEWIAENFVDDEQKEVKTFLANPAMLQRNRQAFEGSRMWLTGYAKYKDYVLLFQRVDHGTRQGKVMPVVYRQTQREWKRTNALSRDETYDVVFSALMAGEVLPE